LLDETVKEAVGFTKDRLSLMVISALAVVLKPSFVVTLTLGLKVPGRPKV